MEARVDVVSGWLSLTVTHNYRWDPGTCRHAQTTNTASWSAHTKGEQRALTCFAGAQHLEGGYCCHDLLPEVSPTDHLHPVLPGFTPFLLCHAPQATPIDPDHTKSYPMVPLCHIADGGQNPGQNTSLLPQGLGNFPRSCGHHVAIGLLNNLWIRSYYIIGSQQLRFLPCNTKQGQMGLPNDISTWSEWSSPRLDCSAHACQTLNSGEMAGWWQWTQICLWLCITKHAACHPNEVEMGSSKCLVDVHRHTWKHLIF